MSVDPTKLLSFVERVENVDSDVDMRRQDRKSIFDDAKESGINTKLMRRLIAERRKAKKANAAEEKALDEYRDLLVTAVSLVKSGLSLREAAKKTGASKSSIHRALAVPEVSHDPEAGARLPVAALNLAPHNPEAVISESDSAAMDEVWRNSARSLRTDVAPHTDSASPSDCTGEVTQTCGGANSTHSGEASGSAGPKTAESSCGLSDDKPVSNPAPQGPITGNSDNMDIPPFLRRVPAAA